jgi:uncharacterized protein
MVRAASTPGLSGSTRPDERISSLDAVRGVAVLGILTMNVVLFGLNSPAYYNLSASEPQGPLDWLVGGIGEIFFDQKFMGMFSMLFGAGIALFADHAAAKGRAVIRLSLWRNLLLLLIGLVHGLFWAGDILVVYALCSPIVLLVRRWPITVLFSAGMALILFIPLLSFAAQGSIPPSGAGLGELWGVPGGVSDAVGLWWLSDGLMRALGMMLIGVAAYRSGFLTGEWDRARYRRVIAWNLPLGVGLAALGLAFVVVNDFSPGVAIVGTIPNTLGTLPMVVAYISIIVLWHKRAWGRPLDVRLRAVGRMALTNYLAQTVLATLTFGYLLDGVELGRTALVLFVLAVWALQLWWSSAWLSRFRQGPVEWLWRAATYRSLSA